VEQWFSPDLGRIPAQFHRGEINYKLAQIVRAEPDAGLIRVPFDWQAHSSNPAAVHAYQHVHDRLAPSQLNTALMSRPTDTV